MNVFIGIDVNSEVDHFVAGNDYSVLCYEKGVEIEYSQAVEYAKTELMQLKFSDPEVQANFERWRSMALEIFESQLPSLEDEQISTFEDGDVQIDFMYRPEEIVVGYFDPPIPKKYRIALSNDDEGIVYSEEVSNFDALIDNLDQYVKATVDEFSFRVAVGNSEELNEVVLTAMQEVIFKTQGLFDKVTIPLSGHVSGWSIDITAENLNVVKH